ncbi:MAG: DUF2924 domain-containing protein [Planctomycetota bacterium]|jgi:hypothetical protein
MAKSVAGQILELQEMTVPELQAKYREVFGEETRSHHKQQLFRKIAWRIQELAEGGLSERAKAKARQLANEADIRISPPRGAFAGDAEGSAGGHSAGRRVRDPRLPVPGTLIEREYKGLVLSMRVLDKGFEYKGRTYRSLSAVAREVTGTHCNGMAFFGLARKREAG